MFASALTRLGVGGPGIAYNEIQDKAGGGEAPDTTPNPNQLEDRSGGAIGWSRNRKSRNIKRDNEDLMDIIQAAMREISKYL